MSLLIKSASATALLACATTAFAHITLPAGPALAGSQYEAAFRVGHACKDARSTTGITVRMPQGFTLEDVPARSGWRVEIDQKGEGYGTVRWIAESAAQALAGDKKTEFVMRGKLPTQTGPIYFKVLQTCDRGSADWAQLPSDVTKPGEKQAFPAARLQVVAPGTALVEASSAWIRATVPGQSGTGGFMKLAAGAPLKLVGVSTPVAGVAEIHEMRMEGDTMRMRAISGLELPARQSVELKPGGHHLMLMELKQPITAGQSVPLTLTFEDTKGAKSTLLVQAPAQMLSAGGGDASAHKH
ncbi:copper chaperone PCu(A)C [Ottowia thiooxydans]|uniref:copper chaperone PCu(A)C n=1 Tax=Ottowia thiooxydans TaxID=219182 RepID=UPI000415432C|nr:copper chaperone PCu(A)C [Ottowia thiooxydans]